MTTREQGERLLLLVELASSYAERSTGHDRDNAYRRIRVYRELLAAVERYPRRRI